MELQTLTSRVPEIPDALLKIIHHLHGQGARCMLAGGGVIDHLIGLEVHDWDIEVYNLTYQELRGALSKFCVPNLVGKSFGVLKCNVPPYEVDFSLPRKDNRTGKGHRAFDVDLLPDLDPIEAARRRDITINSMYIDLRTGELIDPFGGLADLREGCIRATDARTFTEDPLRVLRVMQTLPRKGKYVDASTIALCASIVDEYDTLPKERVFEEFKKLLLLTKTPAMGLLFLRDCGWLKKFPALDALIGCAQHPVHHPEGDVWMHTLYTLDHAAAMRDQLPEEWRLAFMFGMLCHDFGKPAVTDPVEFTAHQHESEGEKIARQFMKTLSDNVELIEKTAAIVLTHMRPYAFYKAGAKEGAWKRLHNIVPLHILAYVTQADASGRAKEAPAQYAPEFELCLRYANAFGKGNIQPVLLGRHLIERGHPPGVGFRAILDQGYQYQLDSGSTDVEDIYRNALKGVDESNHNAPD